MNIKSLLLGSAAAAVAFTGAQAADAIVIAEPEPMEYVRVCDAYGAGFFYIPGTETCLSFSGYVWYQMGANSWDPGDTAPKFGTGATAIIGDGWFKSTRARFNIDARSETEWGTLRSFIRMQGDWGSGADAFSDGAVALDQAFLSLGGFYAGYTESAWAATLNGGASNFGSHSWDGMYYGYQQRHQIGYNFTGGNGLFGTLALEDDNRAGDGYMPDVVAKLGINQGWGAAWVKVGYDESYNLAGDDGFGIGAGVQINMPNSPGSNLRILGYYSDSDNRFGSGGPVGFAAYTPIGQAEWSVLASYRHQFSPTLAASIAGQYFGDFYLDGTDTTSGADAWSAELSVIWTPVTNFEVRTEINYSDLDAPAGFADPDGTLSGFLRFTRYF